jgi:hypothetical protein
MNIDNVLKKLGLGFMDISLGKKGRVKNSLIANLLTRRLLFNGWVLPLNR